MRLIAALFGVGVLCSCSTTSSVSPEKKFSELITEVLSTTEGKQQVHSAWIKARQEDLRDASAFMGKFEWIDIARMQNALLIRKDEKGIYLMQPEPQKIKYSVWKGPLLPQTHSYVDGLDCLWATPSTEETQMVCKAASTVQIGKTKDTGEFRSSTGWVICKQKQWCYEAIRSEISE
jgi:hypothetical protein